MKALKIIAPVLALGLSFTAIANALDASSHPTHQ